MKHLSAAGLNKPGHLEATEENANAASAIAVELRLRAYLVGALMMSLTQKARAEEDPSWAGWSYTFMAGVLLGMVLVTFSLW